MTIGFASMIGAGLFAAFGPAAAAAGPALLVGLAFALVVAICNATSTAQLSAQYPTSGGSYHFGRERLGEWPGFIAGWGFVIGKTASAAAMALTFAAYAAPAEWLKPVAVVALVALLVVNLLGITRTTAVARLLVGSVLALLAIVLVAAWLEAGPAAATAVQAMPAEIGAALGTGEGWLGALQAGGLLFFAFAGYARIATLGEEVREPERTIPRAIVTTLAIVAVIYAIVALTLLATVGPDAIASSHAPLELAVAGLPWAVPLVVVAAALASLGSLLAGLAGITRTALAMARNGDLPRPLAHVDGRRSVPDVALWTVGVGVVILILAGDIRTVIGFSSVGVLTYYLVANLAALTQTGEFRRYPTWMQWLGAILCVALIATLPLPSIITGLAVLAVGVLGRLIVRARAR
ncbi:putative transporter [Pseudoclavibacter triregionum]|nr:putative transporter [Pseudoclavibacter triregionum]